MTHQHQTAHFFDESIATNLQRHARAFRSRRVGPLIALTAFAWVAFFTFAGISAAPGQARAHGGGAYSSLIPVSDFLW